MNRYENIFPSCRKYTEENVFWICNREGRGRKCNKVKEYDLKNGCVYYDEKLICGNFDIERAQILHCEEWKPWFNRKKTMP